MGVKDKQSNSTFWLFSSSLLVVAGCFLIAYGVHKKLEQQYISPQFAKSETFVVDTLLKELPIEPESELFESNAKSSTSEPVIDKAPEIVQIKKPEYKIASDSQKRYHALLKNQLSNWSKEDLAILDRKLQDPRSTFRTPVLTRITTHKETVAQYSHHLEPYSLNRSKQFWDESGEEVLMGSKNRRVPVEIIMAILKVESNFGAYPPPEKVFNVFWTLSLGDHPEVQKDLVNDLDLDNQQLTAKLSRLAKWGRGQLHDLVKISKSEVYPDILEIKGSWAGAFGYCQFIPASYLAYSADGDGDGIIDLYTISDASASIAKYLEQNGWPKTNDREKQRASILRYNKSGPYADCVLALADSLRLYVNQPRIASISND